MALIIQFFNFAMSVLDEFTQNIVNQSQTKNSEIKTALLAVDRAKFVAEDLSNQAYDDYPLPIGWGQTISQPSTVVFMLEQLNVSPGQKILEVGSGCGWVSALLARLVGDKGKVIGMELIPELVAQARENIQRVIRGNVMMAAPIQSLRATCPPKPWRRRERSNLKTATPPHIASARSDVLSSLPEHSRSFNSDPISFKNLQFVAGDGSKGYAKQAPYDRILVSAGAKEIPLKLLEQLKDGGRAVIPVGETFQDMMVIDRRGDEFIQTKYPGFVFVPLVNK